MLNRATNMKAFLLIAAAAIFALALHPTDAAAKGVKLPKAKPTPVPEKVNASGAKITKAGGDSVTIEYSKTTTTYKVNNETQITVDGKHGGSGDLKPGMHAEISVSSIHPNLLLSIQATTPKS